MGTLVDAGKFRILAMATEQRIARYKDVPTLRERGIKVVGPQPVRAGRPEGLPPNKSKSVHLAFKEAMADPRVDSACSTPTSRRRGTRARPNTAPSPRHTLVEVKPLLMKAGLAKAEEVDDGLKRVALEIGMGTDIRGADYTKAAVRALRDALWHNSLTVATASASRATTCRSRC